MGICPLRYHFSKHAKSVDLFLWIKCTSNHHGSRNLQEFIVRTTTFWEKRETFFDYKKCQKSHLPKRVNPCFWSKKCQFFFVSVKTRLVIVLLNDFVENKETFLSIKKKRIFQIPKNHIFPKGLTPVYKQKMPISSLFRFIKIRLEIMLKDFAEKKETFLDYKKQNFQKSKNSHFSKGVNPSFWSEKCQFFLHLF